MSLTITLSDEQVGQIIHYGKTKSITSACNVVQSLAIMFETCEKLYELIEASGYDNVLKKLDDN